MKVIMLAGKARVGKNTFGDNLKSELEKDNLRVATTMYAKYLKMYAKEIYGWNGEEETKPRDFLQSCGNYVRIDLGKFDFFVKRMLEDIEIYLHYADIVIINDVRFPIEIEMIKDVYKKDAISILMTRNEDNDLNEIQRKHLTEVALDEYKNYDYVIENNGTLEELNEKAIELVRSLK